MSPVRSLRAHLGRRGAFLLLISAAWLLLGVAYLTTGTATRPGLVLPLALMPIEAWGVVWVVCGLAGAISAFLRGPGQDTVGFLAVEAIATVWGLSYLGGWLIGSYSRGWITGAIFLTVSGAVIIAAGWAEPEGYSPPVQDPS
jgi:hypothetical protein